ncbi:DNA-processing protein DprA [Candidatus Electronema sp. PJ]|uniref:DNA-processing protein DprA n=1 Tax=Candidatus Electronema sp. PJ TaxID=3401572 RepID=UPI003AA9B2FD
MCSNDEIRAWLVLAAMPGLGCILIHRLIAAFGSPQAALAAGQAVIQVEGIGPKLAALFANPTALARASSWAIREQERAAAAGVQLLSCTDPRYPPLLRAIHDAPVLLWCRGDLSHLQHSAVIALVGSRAATSYGRKISFLLARQLSQAGFTVVSGLAEGIDGQAHAGALAAGGSTVAVLGSGVDIIYPHFHGHLYKQIQEKGLLISEYPLGTPVDGFRFPARNRIISGLSLGVVVVEASAKSGSRITAQHALEQNREVFAVPGRIDSPQSEGTHRLIQQGAKLVHSVEDILAELPMTTGYEQEAVETPPPLPEDLSDLERKLLSLLASSPTDIEELTEKSGQPVAALHGHLLELELKGLIRQLPGQQYERV